MTPLRLVRLGAILLVPAACVVDADDGATGASVGPGDSAGTDDPDSATATAGEAGDDDTTGASSTAPSTTADLDTGDTNDASTGGPGGAHVPPGVLFFDGFDYPVERDADGKFGADGTFGAHGWTWGKDAVLNGPGAGGWLFTTETIPGFTGELPGVDSTHVLCLEAKAGTYANSIDTWAQTDFYLQYGDTDAGPLDTIPADVWIQHWMYIAVTPEQPSLFPPTPRLGKWFYPTRNSYPSNDLEWLFSMNGVMLDSDTVDQGSSAHIDIGTQSMSPALNLTDSGQTVYTDGRPDAAQTLGHCGADPQALTPMDANRWWLLRVHIDHTTDPGVVEVWIRPYGDAWIKIVDTTSSDVVEWNPVNTVDGHRGLRFPTTMSNWSQEPTQQTTHGDWWVYIDDFAIAAGEHAGGQGSADLPQYADCPSCGG